MGRHSAPEPPEGPPSVVRLASARHRGTRAVALAHLDPATAEAFVDDLTLITADDQLLDRIAAGQGDVFVLPPQFAAGFPAGSLAPLLASWRSEIVDPQWPCLPTVEQAQEAVRAQSRPAFKPAGRALKPMLTVAVAISALLLSSAAVGAQSARPGDTLWPLAQVLYTDRAHSYEAGAAARGSLDNAAAALSSGNPTSAKIALTSAQKEMDRVKLSEVRAPLQTDYDKLMRRAEVAVVTESEQSSANLAALESASHGATGSSGAIGVKARPSGTSRSGNSTGTRSSTSSAGPGKTGGPVTTNPSSQVPTTGTTAVVTAPSDPSDPVAAPTGPTAPGTSGPSLPSVTGTPVTTGPVITSPVATAPGTTDPVVTDPVTTGPATAPSTDPVTTQASTTSELPTPTQDPGIPVPGGNAVSIGPAAASGQ
jgi:hypothetical protein